MSSLARRTLRTTAAAAGMAALGVGLAGNALAAPADSEPASTPESAQPALPALPVGNPLASLPSGAHAPALPMLFVFQAPTINTAGPSGSALPAVADRMPAAAPVRTQPAARAQAAPATARPQTGSAQVTPAASPGRAGALSGLDSAGMFDDLLSKSVVDQRGLGNSTLGLDGPG
jgi:hypothetical protein